MHFIGIPFLPSLIFLCLVFGMLYHDASTANEGLISDFDRAKKWTFRYIAAALIFAVVLGLGYGVQTASLFMTGYLLEKILSVDNLIVFGAVFAYMRTPLHDQYKILKWGVLGAIVFRLIFTFIGAGSLYVFGGWVEFIFALLVGWSAVTMLRSSDNAEELIEERWFTKLAREWFPASGAFMVCLITIECTDVLFSFDSVPTVIAATRDPFLIYTSMIFAILGLRSMYFLLAAVQKKMAYVEKAVIYILFFIAAKLAAHALFGFDFDAVFSFLIIISVLLIGVGVSMVAQEKTA